MGVANNLIDTSATFNTTGDGLAGCIVRIIAGSGIGESKLIVSNTKTKLFFAEKDNWTTNPDPSSTYHIGNIDFNATSGIISGKDFRESWAGRTLNFGIMVIECDEQAETYSTGRVTLTNGTTTVVGIGTTFASSHNGENFFVPGYADKEFFVWKYVDTTTLFLTSVWTGETGNYAYSIGAKLLKVQFYLEGSSTVYRTIYADMANSPLRIPIHCKAKELQWKLSNNRVEEEVKIHSLRIVEPTVQA